MMMKDQITGNSENKNKIMKSESVSNMDECINEITCTRERREQRRSKVNKWSIV